MPDNSEFSNKAFVPIYKQLANCLKQQILSGKIKNGDRLPSELELAEQFGVNKLTLRKGLLLLEQQKLLVSQRGKGTYVIFRESPKLCKIGILVSWQDHLAVNLYLNKILVGVMSALQEIPGASLNFVILDKSETVNTLQKKLIQYDGLIVPGGIRSHIRLLLHEVFRQIPIVFISSYSPEIIHSGHICVDLKDNSVELAVRHLYELGHRRIAYCCSGMKTESFQKRSSSFKKLVRQYGLIFEPEYYYIWNGEFFESEYSFCHRMLALKCPPTAIVCGTDANGLLMAAFQAGKRVPEDLSIIGFDGFSQLNPILTNLEQPVEEMSKKAADLLIHRIATGKNDSQMEYFFDVCLNIARSTGKVKKQQEVPDV